MAELASVVLECGCVADGEAEVEGEDEVGCADEAMINKSCKRAGMARQTGTSKLGARELVSW